MDVGDDWDQEAKTLQKNNRRAVESELLREFGEQNANIKKQNFMDLGPKQFSVLAFHNLFFQQIRVAFIMGAYYPSLTGACALGERILNHLILQLREDYRATPDYKRVHRKNSAKFHPMGATQFH